MSTIGKDRDTYVCLLCRGEGGGVPVEQNGGGEKSVSRFAPPDQAVEMQNENYHIQDSNVSKFNKKK